MTHRIPHARWALALPLLATAAGCKKAEVPVAYQAVPVEHRDIIVSAQASGRIHPDTVVEVKSRASGEVLEILVESGEKVRRGQPVMRIDPRTPKNNVDQANADLEVARSQLQIAQSQLTRADELLKAQSITQAEHEAAQLTYANAKAQVVRATVALENAKIALEDTEVKAPVSGTIIEKLVERGQMIASATQNVSGGTVLLRMADMNLVQTVTLVDETDIGKVKPGLEATVTVDAFPNRPFKGTVLKIEPNDTTVNNVTMFPVRVRVNNEEGLLLPGMNSEVQIHVGKRMDVLAIPNAALRTQKDVASAAQVLGLSPAAVQQQLAAQQQGGSGGDAKGGKPEGDQRRATLGASTPTAPEKKPGGPTMTTADGRTIKLPPGVKEERVKAIFAKFRNGETPDDEDRKILNAIKAMNPQQGGGQGGQGGERARGTDYQFGGRYIVFVRRGAEITPVAIRTGLTDLDYSEVVTGLNDGDSVMVLPSASLVNSQAEMKDRINRMTGGGMPGMRQQGAGGGAPAGGQGGARPPAGGAR